MRSRIIRLTGVTGLTKNDRMRQTLTAVGLVLAVPLGAISAPFVHVHLRGSGADHHHARQIHAHIDGHAPFHVAREGVGHNGPAVGDHERERGITLQWFVAVSQALFDVPPALVTSVALEVPAESAGHYPVRVVHGHDPPFVSSLGSRAPPPFPS